MAPNVNTGGPHKRKYSHPYIKLNTYDQDTIINGAGWAIGLGICAISAGGRCQAAWSRSSRISVLVFSGRLMPTVSAGAGVVGWLRNRSGCAA